MGLIKDLLDVIYPSTCPGCGKVMEPGGLWCKECIKNVWDPRLINSSFTEHLSGCYTLCRYEGTLRDCIISLKYGGKKEKVRAFPPLLDRFPFWDRIGTFDMVIPVPLSKAKMEKRGYNQVDLMFETWMKVHYKNYVRNGLVRIRSGETQSLLSRVERFENIKGLFHIRKGLSIAGKTILLVDDVYTTGATMESCAHELRRAGAEKVSGLTIASGAS